MNFSMQKKILTYHQMRIWKKKIWVSTSFISIGKIVVLLPKYLSDFIEKNRDFCPIGVFYYEMKNVPITSTTTVSDAKRTLRDIGISNTKRFIFGHLIISCLKKKFNFLCEEMEGSTDTSMISESKLDKNFTQGQFVTEGSTHFSQGHFVTEDSTHLSDLITIKVEGEFTNHQ